MKFWFLLRNFEIVSILWLFELLIGDVGTYDFWTWWYLNFWYSLGSNSTALRQIQRQFLVPRLFSSIIYMYYVRAVSGNSLRHLVSEVKVNLFHVLICCNMKIFKQEACLILPQDAIQVNPFQIYWYGVTWSRFKYFTLLATFVVKLIHFCTSSAVFHCIYPI